MELLVDPIPHPAGAKIARTGLGDEDGPDAVADFQAPTFWRFLGVHNDDLSTQDDYSRLRPDSTVVTTERQVDALLDWGTDYERWCAAQTPQSDTERRLFAGEAEHGRKMTVQLGYGPGYWASPASPPEIELPQWYQQHLTSLLLCYLTEDDVRVRSLPTPQVVIDTSAGWPIFASGIGAKVLSASFYIPGRPFIESWRAAKIWAAENGLDQVSTFGNGYGTRTGTNAKPGPAYTPGGTGFVQYATMTSRFPRRRQIYMATISQFLALRTFTKIAKATRKYVIPGAWHTGNDDAEHIERTAHLRGEWLEADISGYDTSISRSHHRALLNAARSARRDLLPAIEDYFVIDNIGTIYPHPLATHKGNRSARYVTRSGLLSSGILPTAEMGNIYHLPIILEVAKRCGHKDPLNALLQKQFAILIQGDDLLLKIEGLTADLMKTVYAEAGFTVKAVVANRFLMRHRFGGSWYPVGGRIVQQTAFGEHEPTGEHSKAIAILGLAARWAHGPHPAVAAMIREGVALTDLALEGVVDGPTATRWLATSRGATMLRKALEAANSGSWAERIRRDAEHSLSAAAILKYAMDAGLIDASVAEGVLGNKAVTALLSLPAHRRERIRSTLWAATTSGITGDPFDSLALSLLGMKE